jgi:hypothetical protein
LEKSPIASRKYQDVSKKEKLMEDFATVDWLTLYATYTLTSAVTAFRTSRDEQDTDHCGPICELPEDADLIVCGGGFSKRTVRVRYGDCDYYVFWRDLASAFRADHIKITAEQAGLLRLAEVVGKQGEAATVQMSGRSTTDRE